MNDKKIIMNEHQWRLFEYNMSRWMVENKYILDNEEKKKFYKCANMSLGTGLLNGWLVYLLCKKYKTYFTPFARTFLSFSSGIYSSIVINKIYRRKAYTEILTSKTSMTDKARQVMNEILNDTPNNNNNYNNNNNNNNINNNSNINNINNKLLVEENDINSFKENKNVIEFKEDYNIMNNDNFVKTGGEPNFEESKNMPLIQEVNDKFLNDPNNELERQSSSFLNDPNEGKYVSWDEIRRRNN